MAVPDGFCHQPSGPSIKHPCDVLTSTHRNRPAVMAEMPTMQGADTLTENGFRWLIKTEGLDAVDTLDSIHEKPAILFWSNKHGQPTASQDRVAEWLRIR